MSLRKTKSELLEENAALKREVEEARAMLRESEQRRRSLADAATPEHAEADLRRAHDMLEQRVRERTAELEALIWQLEAMNAKLQCEVGERLSAEEALRESEARHLLIVEQIPVVAYVAKPVTAEILYISPQVESLLGCPPWQSRQDPQLRTRHIHPADRDRMLAEWDRLTREGEVFAMDYRVLDGTRTLHWVHDQARAVRDRDGRIVSYQGVMLDITERKRAEEAWRESEDRFLQLADNIHDAFWIRDVIQNRLVYVSPAFDRMWGCDHRAFADEPIRFLEFVHPDDRARVAAAQARQVEGSYSEEYRIVRPDGEVRWVHVRAFPVRDADGQVWRIAGITEDITDRKAAEERLQQYNEELEALVRQRTEQVRELERQRGIMEQLAAAGRVAARIAHEINNPLAGVKNAFLLVKDAIPAEHPYAHYVPRIQVEIDRIAQIIRQMFDLCPPRDGVEERAPLGQLVQDTAMLFETASRKRDVRLTFELADDGCSEVALPGNSLRQILHNLIQNALEFSPAGATVRVRAWIPQPGWVTVCVQDEGPGVPEERQPFIFEPFYTTKSVHQGTGLGMGLSICRGLTERMGGHIAFQTESGRGTTFSVSLPLTNPSAAFHNGGSEPVTAEPPP